ncbi:MAG: integrin alpha [Pseudomonadota bacterium]
MKPDFAQWMPRRTALAAVIGLSVSAQAANFPAEVEVDLLRESAGNDGNAGFTLFSDEQEVFSRLGSFVANVGDLNNDGLPDFAVSDSGVNRAYVVFGDSNGFPATLRLDTLDPAEGGDGSAGFVLIDTDRLRIAGAGDVNNDGVDDMIWSSISLAETYVLYGQTTGFPATISPEELRAANGGDGTLGSVLLVAGEPDLRLGDTVAGAGDTNGDGIDDLILRAGAGGDCNFNVTFCSGEYFLVYGVDGGFGAGIDLGALRPANGGDGSAGRVIIGPARSDITAPTAAVAGIGDLNDDGLDDIVLGTPETGVQAPAGRAFVVYGDSDGSAELLLADLLAENGGDGSIGFAINPEVDADLSRVAAASAGDVNGDTIPDLLIGAALASPNGITEAGNAYLILGQAGSFGAELDLASLRAGDGSAGSVFETDTADDGTGYAVGAAGDLNADGIDDLIIAARREGAGTLPGSVFLLYGTASGYAPVVDLTSLLAANGGNGEAGTVFQASSADAFDEVQAIGIGDVNGDGIDDLAIGANRARGVDEGFDDNGEAYVIFGRLPPQLSTQIIGLNLSLGACRNVDSGETVSVGLPEFALDESFDCAALDLTFAPGDQVILQGEGTNFGTALNGSVIGLADGGNVVCRREDTLEEVTVDIAADGTWDCEAGGFSAPNQVPVTVIVRGSAEPLFTSPERISLTLDGMDTRTAACQNLTDPQTVTGVLADVRLSETIDCEALGLTASAGDTVSIQGRGRNFGAGLSGSFEQLATDVIVRCENNVLGEVQFITPAPGDNTFDCAATGLTLRNGDTVTVTVRGALPAAQE